MKICLLVEYDGTEYAGWQIQPNAVTIQEIIEAAALKTLGVNVPVVAAGRTDAGVHARGQVAHMHISEDSNQVPLEKLADALNSRLPQDVRIRDIAPVHDGFHARFHAEWREYVYMISREPSVFARHFSWYPELPYSVDLLGEAAREFEGRHDYTTFSKHNPDTQKYECVVHTCHVEPQNDRIMIRIRADRFVYGMCRSIVGTMMAAARGKFEITDIARAFDNRDRSVQCALAPPHGLILNRVGYPEGLFENHDSF